MVPIARAMVLVFIASTLSLAASPDQWKGLALGKTTPDQARATLGNPKKESVERLRPGKIGALLVDEIRSKIFLCWQYENVGGFSRADLFFRDGKLVALALAPGGGNKILARDLSSIYDGAPFVELLQPGDLYEWNLVAKRVQRSYPVVYDVATATERTFVVASVTKGSAANLRSLFGGDEHSFPGSVFRIQYFSRGLERPRARNDMLR